MRGSSSPPGGGSSVSAPISVRMMTRPGWSAVTSPMMAASFEYLTWRRVAAEHAADAADGRVDRDGLAVQVDADVALAGDFIEDRTDTAAGRITDDVDVLGRIQHGFDSPP